MRTFRLYGEIHFIVRFFELSKYGNIEIGSKDLLNF